MAERPEGLRAELDLRPRSRVRAGRRPGGEPARAPAAADGAARARAPSGRDAGAALRGRRRRVRAHTRVALDYLRCTTEACQYQIYDNQKDAVAACSAAWLETCGYGEEDVLGRNFRHLQGPRTDHNEIRRIAASMAAGEPCDCTLVNYRADGSVWENDFSIVPIRRHDNNEPTHWLSVHGDASALHWSARSSPSTEHRAVSLSDRSRSKSSSDVSSVEDDPPRARSRSGSPSASSGSSSGSSSGLTALTAGLAASPAALATALHRAEAAEGALASMTRRAEKAEKRARRARYIAPRRRRQAAPTHPLPPTFIPAACC